MHVIADLPGYIFPFLIILSIVVFVHEFGHYWVARRNGVRVETFSIGFGPELFGRNDRHGTRWKFSAIPLGGYVKMLGDADAASATVDAQHAAEPDSFPAKTVAQRAAVVVAGPAANFLFAIVVLAILFSASGRPYTPASVGEVMPDTPAAAAGLQPGDRLVEADGEPITEFEELQRIVSARPGDTITFLVQRDGERLPIEVTPAPRALDDGTTIGQIGIRPTTLEFRRSNPLMAPIEATAETVRMVAGTLYAIGEMIVGSRGTDELGGPLRIAQMSGQVAQEGIVVAIWFTAILSINLGLINLFPIPMLDGGHLVLYAIEAARGKPLTERSQEIAFRFGLALVLSLMVFATWNDLVNIGVFRLFTGSAS